MPKTIKKFFYQNITNIQYCISFKCIHSYVKPFLKCDLATFRIKLQGGRQLLSLSNLKTFSFIVFWAVLLLMRSCCQYNYSFVDNLSFFPFYEFSLYFMLFCNLQSGQINFYLSCLFVNINFLSMDAYLSSSLERSLPFSSVFPLAPSVLNYGTMYQVYALLNLSCVSSTLSIFITLFFCATFWVSSSAIFFIGQLSLWTGVQMNYWVRSYDWWFFLYICICTYLIK